MANISKHRDNRKNIVKNYPFSKWTNKKPLELLLFVWSIVKQYIPNDLKQFIYHYINKFFLKLSPYINLDIEEFSNAHWYYTNKIYNYVAAYLGERGYKTAKHFQLNAPSKGTRSFLMKDDEEVTDVFKGVKVWWVLKVIESGKTSKRAYRLVFHQKNREIVSGEYLDYVINEGKLITEKNRTRRLYLNQNLDPKDSRNNPWKSVEFNHPASFDNLAMDPVKKREIVEDLLKFREGKDFYAKVGKAWKRGYLLYGPPGTGKSTMMAAMANLLGYDVYDVELTTVRNNEELKKVLITTTSRSVIAIEDIDCSLDITGKRSSNNVKTSSTTTKEPNSETKSKVTLLGLLNFIDGIWSSSEGERIIVFMTNSLNKLDPALIRTGRMDKRIEMSYCCFEGFKVLAKNFLSLEDHPKFDLIGRLLEVTHMTPADVAKNLMPGENPERCLDNLIRALEKARDDEAAWVKAYELNKMKKAEEANGTSLMKVA